MNFSAFVTTLPVVAIGMAGIFIVMALVYFCVKLMTKFMVH